MTSATSTLHVRPGQPDAYQVIGAALAAASDGSVISVATGTYHEALYVNDRRLSIVAADGPGTVLIDASSAGYPTASCTNGSLELRDLVLRAGHAPAVSVDRARLTVTGCELRSASTSTVEARDGSAVTLRRCRIRNDDGPAVSVGDGCRGTVEDCETESSAVPSIMVASGAEVSVKPDPGAPAAGTTTPVTGGGGARRPPAVTAAVLLMVPAALAWLVAGVGFLVATSRAEGDPKWLLWILALAILALCLLVEFVTVVGMWLAWTGDSVILRGPASFTVVIFGITLVFLLVRRRLGFEPTMLTPLVVGGLAAIALVLLRSRPARAWFAARQSR